MNRLRVLVVEDEPLARQALAALVAEVEGFEPVGEAADGRTAVARIDALRPDLVFLDVSLPEWSGLEVLDRVRHRPAVIFTTAYDRYAVAAFELEAVDYLVKPFGRRRFLAAVERVWRRLSEPAFVPPERPPRVLYARRGRWVEEVAVDSIVRVEGADDYARIVRDDGERFLVPVRLGDLAARLAGRGFVRVHRCHLVRLGVVREVRPRGDGRLVVLLADGCEVAASRAGSARLRQALLGRLTPCTALC